MDKPTTDIAPAAEPSPVADPAKLKTLLNLPETATDLDIIQTMAAVIADLQEKFDALQSDYTALRGEQVANRLEHFADVITDETRDYWTDQLIANREAAEGALTALRGQIANRDATPAPEPAPAPVANVAEKCATCGQGEYAGGVCNKCGAPKPVANAEPAPIAPPVQPLANRATADTRPLAALIEAPAGDAAQAIAIRNRAEAIVAENPRTPWPDAFEKAEKEIRK